MDKQVLITGGTGFIGRALCSELLARGYQLSVLSRQPAERVRSICGPVEAVSSLASLRSHAGFNAVINLAGEGIADKPWTEKRKKALRDSRIDLTNNLIDIISTWPRTPSVMVSGSAVGFYGNQGNSLVTEDSPPNDEFTHQLCKDWEESALAIKTLGVRVCLSRTGIVVGPGGGFLQRMVLPFKLGLGGRLGRGDQYMPWVHRDDVVSGLIWMLESPSASGPYNLVSPHPVTNREFTRYLASVLGRVAVIPVPAPVLKLILGEMSRLLLTGQKAIPARLEEAGFRFRYPTLEEALLDATR